MHRSTHARRGLHLLLASAGAALVMASVPAMAQEIEEIVVTAPPVYEEIQGQPTGMKAPKEKVTVAHYIYYGDLDLTKQDDVARLEGRVNNSAKEVCAQLDKIYPLTHPDKNCVWKAADGGMKQVHEAVARAERK